MSKFQSLSFIEFQEAFATEEQCFQYLKRLRFPSGFECPKCGHTVSYFVASRKLFQCAKCRHQASVTANTIFHKTRTPLKKWFLALFMIGTDKGGVSAMRLSKLLGISYVTAWTITQKIRSVLTVSDLLHNFFSFMELDAVTLLGQEAGKEAHGSSAPAHILCGVETIDAAPGRIVMKVVGDINRQSVETFSITTAQAGSRIRTDERSFFKYLENRFDHSCDLLDHPAENRKLPWSHILINNVRSYLRGTYFGVSTKHLQRYLNEFCYRFNHRHNETQLFNVMISACVGAQKRTYAELIE